MEVGSVVEWRKRDGDEVRAGEVLFTLQSDKAVNEIEALDSGILRLPPDSPAPGVEVPIGTLLAYIVRPGEPAPFERPGASTGARPSPEAAGPTRPPARETVAASAGAGVPGRAISDGTPGTPSPQRHAAAAPSPSTAPAANPGAATSPPTPVAAGAVASAAPAHGDASRAARRGGPPISPRARRVAAELGLAWSDLAGSGRTGRIVERDVRAAALATAGPPLRVNPLARRRAEELGVDLAALAAARPERRVEVADVEAAARAAVAPGGTPPTVAAAGATPLSIAPPGATPPPTAATAAGSAPSTAAGAATGIRRLISSRMAASAHTAAPVT